MTSNFVVSPYSTAGGRHAALATALGLCAALMISGCSSHPTEGSKSAEQAINSVSGLSSAAGSSADATATPQQTLGVDAGDVEEDLVLEDLALNSDDKKFVNGSGTVTVVDIRTSSNPDFDRVVFELGGEGTPSWSVSYSNYPAQLGSGDTPKITGAHTLTVDISQSALPFESGVAEFAVGPAVSPSPDSLISEIVFSGQFEGTSRAFVGIKDEKRKFRAFSISKPARVVIDIARED